ncbi:5-oxoprolinase/urea amidolyase family protein [Humibacter ginsenosidimutans]|uniref:5-oxoprolinase/urea amidolyase family protein n=1 Tax=Humibacter ginsenosidimutans TaxID=2599293 RepID=A0A5B8M4B0_9MICO|nr:5-oxoprolinase/urea amidolyase family protein [Humibacter ginsenosidimutans]QDZ15041.1 5-oxoprolinase/urea amidolyase family protein [Humibacter ginsenosidimutans]
MIATIRLLGDRALLVDLADLGSVLALRAALTGTRPAGVLDIVPAARTLAVMVDPARLPLDSARTWLEHALDEIAAERGSDAGARDAGDETTVVIDVVYDGDDLAEVEGLTGIPAAEIVRRHTEAAWRVAFGGFAPGFGYLVTDDDWFEVPRRAAPRTVVPEGAVGLAGPFSGVYPRQGPGGWRLIGRTDVPLWRPTDARPALLAPGTRVRFRAVEELSGTARPESDSSPDASVRSSADADLGAETQPGAQAEAGAETPSLTVVSAGMLLLIEDLGRTGSASIGAGRSGALDRGALRLGNRLVGNVEAAAGLEVAFGARLRFERSTWFAVTGARGRLTLNGHPIEPDAALPAAPGDLLELGAAEHGLRYVVALRGGVRAPLTLDSASTDVGARIGPDPLRDGDSIALGTDTAGGIPAVDALTVWSPPDDEVDVHVVPGPRQDWFDAASVADFYDVAWEVTQASNRVGMRLRSRDGVVLRRASTLAAAELPSEPMVPGAIQVPPSGEPTVLLADGPVTGGYPVIAVVADADLDLFAQLRPDQRVRFRHAR